MRVRCYDPNGLGSIDLVEIPTILILSWIMSILVHDAPVLLIPTIFKRDQQRLVNVWACLLELVQKHNAPFFMMFC